MTSKAAGAVAHLSFDERYLARRERARGAAQQPGTAAAGVIRDTRNLGTDLVDGVTGILTQPARGYKQAGIRGFAVGIGKGLVGAAVKPTAGILDFVTRTAQGVANQARGSSAATQQRIRPPRKLYGDKKVVRQYDYAEAAAHEVLAEFRAGRHRREQLVHCVDLIPREGGLAADVAILTERRLILAVWRTKRVLRHVSLDDLQGFEPTLDDNGGGLVLSSVVRQLWKATVSSTQRRMRACMPTSRFAARPADESLPKTRTTEVECVTPAVRDAFIISLRRAVRQFAQKGQGAAAGSSGGLTSGTSGGLTSAVSSREHGEPKATMPEGARIPS